MVVMYKLPAYRTESVRELIEERGAELRFLLYYSSSLNPIEEVFSKIKWLLRKAAAHTNEVLIEAIAQALSAVTPRDARVV